MKMMIKEKEYVLADHKIDTVELGKINEVITSLKNQYLSIKHKDYYDVYDTIERIEEGLYNCLLILADHSIPIFNRMDEIESFYFKNYSDTKVAKAKWLKKYGEFHQPFDTLKEKCFKLFNNIGKRYPMSIRLKTNLYQKFHEDKFY